MLATALQQDELFERPPTRTRPFLKWAGGKFRVLEHILPILPEGDRLAEPFAGSVAVSLSANFPRFLVADANADLVNLYRSIQADVSRFSQSSQSAAMYP